MPRLSPVNYKKLVKVFERAGFVHDRTEEDHLIYTKRGIPRPVVIPTYPAVPVFIIQNNLRSAGLPRADYFRLLAE